MTIKKIIDFLFNDKCLIMYVSYDLVDNSIISTNWIGLPIKYLSGKLTNELWDSISNYCTDRTTIYIWAGMDIKHLAYCEPIDNYLKNPHLLKTGQGFSFHSKIRYGQSEKIKCKLCGNPI